MGGDLAWLENEGNQVCRIFFFLFPNVWWPYHAFASPLSEKQFREVGAWPHDMSACTPSAPPALGQAVAPGLTRFAHRRMTSAPCPMGLVLASSLELRAASPSPSAEVRGR